MIHVHSVDTSNTQVEIGHVNNRASTFCNDEFNVGGKMLGSALHTLSSASVASLRRWL